MYKYRQSWFILLLANLVLQDTIERIYVGNCYGDIPRGIFLIRGENVVLLGEIVSFYNINHWQFIDNKEVLGFG